MADVKRRTVDDVRRRLGRGPRRLASAAVEGQTAQQNTDSVPSIDGEQSLDELGLTAEQSQALRNAGYRDRNSLRNASDEALQALPGIGKATVRNLRERLK